MKKTFNGTELVIPNGWRKLAAGEIKQTGDLFTRANVPQWLPVRGVGHTIPEQKTMTFIRKA